MPSPNTIERAISIMDMLAHGFTSKEIMKQYSLTTGQYWHAVKVFCKKYNAKTTEHAVAIYAMAKLIDKLGLAGVLKGEEDL